MVQHMMWATHVQLSTSLASCSRLCSSMPLKASHLQGGLTASHMTQHSCLTCEAQRAPELQQRTL